MSLRRLIFGSPLATSAMEDQRLANWRALAVFSSDALSSVAYATEEILFVLVAAGSAALSLSLPVALVIVALLAMVTMSYWQTIHAYPGGGGAFIVAHENLGEWPGLVAAAALLIDYVLTVAVSVSAGVRALTSAWPAFGAHAVSLSLVALVFITWANLRGLRESSGMFAIPTYSFVVLVLALVVWGGVRVASGSLVPVPVETVAAVAPLSLLLVLRAFSAGCTAMTGVEAISNGVPAFRPPVSDNAGKTLVAMAVLLGTMFLGITILARVLHLAPSETESVLSQLGHAVFGPGLIYTALQAFTALILLLAANTSYADFPLLASVLARRDYLPRQFANRGDRLAFSNGIIALAALAAVLVVLFQADTHALVPLYAVGVFLSFTLSQAGMVRRWLRLGGRGWEIKALINGLGGILSGTALLVLIESKFLEGAWIILVLVPIVLLFIRAVNRHYAVLNGQLSLRLGGTGQWMRRLEQQWPKVVVPVTKLHRGTLAALHFARSISDDVTAVMVDMDPVATAALKLNWQALEIPEPLVVLPSPYRSIAGPLITYLDQQDNRQPERGPAVVVVPYFVPTRWWHNLIHNQSAFLLRSALLFDRSQMGETRIIVDVPYHLKD